MNRTRLTSHGLIALAVIGVCLVSAFAQDAPAPAPAPAPAEAAPAPAPAPAEAAPAPPPPPPLTDIRQVQVKVWISEANERGIRDIGANLNFVRFVRGVEQTGSVQEARTNLLPLDQFGTLNLPFPNQTLFPPPLRPDLDNNLANGLQDRQGAGMSFSIIDTPYGTIDGTKIGRASCRERV